MHDEKRLGGRYLLMAEIGRGPIATVYRAVDIESDQEVTVNVIHSRFQTDPRFVIRFREHLKTIAELSHPNLASILDYGLLEGDFYITTEWIEGSKLSTYIAEHGALSPYQAVRLTRQICAAVGEIHQHGLIHRDLKPETILLDAGDQVRVTDIGLSSLLSESGLSKTDVLLNGVSYISPEQARGEPIGPESDIYSIGIILFEMLTNRPPFASNDSWSVISMHAGEIPPSPRKFNPLVPVELSEIVEQALQKTPDRRFTSVRSLEAALENLPQNELAFWHGIPSGVRSKDLSFILPLMLTSPLRKLMKGGHLSTLVTGRMTQKLRLGPVLALQFLASFLISFVLLFAVTGMVLDGATQSTVNGQRERTNVEVYEINDSSEALAGVALIAPPYAPLYLPAVTKDPESTAADSELVLADEEQDIAVVNLEGTVSGGGNGGSKGNKNGKGDGGGKGKGKGKGNGGRDGDGGGKGKGKGNGGRDGDGGGKGKGKGK
jgi:serine/threonine protein kinase